jgi:hypothetical protein
VGLDMVCGGHSPDGDDRMRLSHDPLVSALAAILPLLALSDLR